MIGVPPTPTPLINLRFGLHQSARLEQRLLQSPQMIQAMQILQLPSLELMERIEAELTENPFLEVSEGEAEQDPSEDPADPHDDRGENADSTEGLEGMLDELERYERDFGDGPAGPRLPAEESDRKYEAMNNTAAQPECLADAVLQQIAMLTIEDEDRQVLEYIVWSLDEHGYLPEDRDDVARELSRQLNRIVAPEEIHVGLRRLRRVTHPALGATDLRDALLLQLDEGEAGHPLERTILAEHLDDLEANRLPRISKATGRTVEEIKDAIEVIRSLDPHPGAEYGGRTANTITPEVIVEEVDGEFVVRLDRERSRELIISPAYRRLLQKSSEDEKVREWVKQRLESARWFIDALRQRHSTLERIAREIFKRQHGFLERGVSALQPMRMQEVADALEVHISTISRGVSGKYAQTPNGIFPLKYFFAGGTTKSTGEATSRVSVQDRLRQLVDGEDKTAPLSDDQLAEALAAKDGIHIARRTVSKYRRGLGIGSSSQRREF
jgi:RNA polymerase sigma-54 factor